MKESYPDHNIPNAQKNKKWILKYGKAMWDEWKNRTLYHEGRERMIECQLYAKGQQTTEKYKSMLDAEGGKGYLNLDWTPISVLPKYIDIVVGKILRTGLRVEARSIDKLGIDTKQHFRHTQEAIQILSERMRESQVFQSMFGKPMESEDLEVFMEMDYKDSYEAVAEDVVKVTDETCDENEIYRGVVRNIAVEGIGGVRMHEDENGVARYRKVNPIEFVYSTTSSPDFRDAYHFGEVVYRTISELKALDINDEIMRGDWVNIAQKSGGKHGNRSWSENDYQNQGEVWFDTFRIPCLDFEFKSFKTIAHSKKKGKFQDIVKKRSDEYQAPDGVEVMKKQVSTWYKGLMVIDEDIIFNTGEITNIARGDKSTSTYGNAYSNFIMYAPSIEDGNSTITSIASRAIPFVDGAQIGWLNFQNVVARAVPKGGYVDAKAMADAASLLKLKDPLEILKLFKSKGWMIGVGDPNPGTSNRPIIEMENGLGKDFPNYLNAMDWNINQIREVTGLNQVVDASTPASGTLVGTAKIAEAATNNSLVPILIGKKSIRERAAKCVVKKVQSIIIARTNRGMELPPIYKGLGQAGLATLKSASSFALAEFAIRVKNEPSDEEIMAFMQELERAVQNQEITTAQSLKAKQLGRESINRAEAYLTKEIKKNKAEAEAKAKSEMEMNGQIQQQSVMAASEKEQAKIQAEAQKEIAVVNAEFDRKERLIQMEYQFKIELAKVEGGSRIEQKTIEKTYDLAGKAIDSEKKSSNNI